MPILSMKKLLTVFFAIACAVGAFSQEVVLHEQHAFPDKVPAGGYSGITWLGDTRYAVVSDNGRDGFFLFDIQLDSLGDITSVENLGFYGSETPNHDNEGIAWCAPRNTLFISGEKDNKVREFTLEGLPTGRTLILPKEFDGASRAYGLEALTYDAENHLFYTTSESTLPADGERATAPNGVENKLRLVAVDDSLQTVAQYPYLMDQPTAEAAYETYAFGVSALAALGNGHLLVLEREFAVPQSKLGAYVNCKIYDVAPDVDSKDKLQWDKPLAKTLVAEWMTAIGLLDFSIANYEGMCLGPKLPDGRQTIILVADSQNQYANILADYFKSIVIF